MTVAGNGTASVRPLSCRRERSDGDWGPRMIREKISQAEIDFYFDMLVPDSTLIQCSLCSSS